MQLIALLLAINSAVAQPPGAATGLLPVSEMKPIEPADRDWPLGMHMPPDTYEVHLDPEHTIQQHFKTIGKDLGHLIKHRYDDPEHEWDYASFVIHLEDQADLSLVRRDPRVTFIGEYATYTVIDDPMGDDEETHLLSLSRRHQEL